MKKEHKKHTQWQNKGYTRFNVEKPSMRETTTGQKSKDNPLSLKRYNTSTNSTSRYTRNK